MKSLLDRTLKAEILKDNTAQVDVEYRRKRTGAVVNIRCMALQNEQETDSKDRIHSIKFSAMYLTHTPENGDEILLDGVKYRVLNNEGIHKVMDGCWDVIAQKKKHNTGRI